MAKPNSRETFKEYCLRQLGKGMIEINLTDDQIEDCIDTAIQKWQQEHMDGNFENIVKHVVTQDDIDNGYIILPDEVQYVIKLHPFSSSYGNSGMFDIKYQMHLHDIWDLKNAGSMVNYIMTKQHLSFIRDVIDGQEIYEFSRRGHRLYIQMDWSRKVRVGDYIIMNATISVNPEVDTAAYNDSWLKKYATALLQKLWGINLIKFPNIEMLGGVTFNADAILAEGKEQIEKLEESLIEKYQYPPEFYVG